MSPTHLSDERLTMRVVVSTTIYIPLNLVTAMWTGCLGLLMVVAAGEVVEDDVPDDAVWMGGRVTGTF